MNVHACHLHWEWLFKKQNCYQLLTKISVGPALDKRGLFSFKSQVISWCPHLSLFSDRIQHFTGPCRAPGTFSTVRKCKWSIWHWQFSLQEHLPMLNDTTGCILFLWILICPLIKQKSSTGIILNYSDQSLWLWRFFSVSSSPPF